MIVWAMGCERGRFSPRFLPWTLVLTFMFVMSTQLCPEKKKSPVQPAPILFLNLVLSLTPHCLHLNHAQILGVFQMHFLWWFLSLCESYVRKLGTSTLPWHLCHPLWLLLALSRVPSAEEATPLSLLHFCPWCSCHTFLSLSLLVGINNQWHILLNWLVFNFRTLLMSF